LFFIFKERTVSISDILSSSGTSTPPIHSTTPVNPAASNTTPRLIINNTVSSTPSFTVLSSTVNKDEISHPSSPKRTVITTNTNKRSVSSSKSPGIPKKQRITMTNNISTNINDINIRDTTRQNKNLPSMDEIAFFDKVILFRKISFYFIEFIKVQKTLRSPLVFDNFLRCILLYTKRIISRIELFELIQSYLR
jgi:hypothetical protein